MIIFTSLVFIAVLVTSYWYFADLERRGRDQRPDTGIADEPERGETSTAHSDGDGTPLWTFELNGGPSAAPTVLRYDGANRFILVQDTYHILHAISTTGKKLWNAQLGGPILDSIQQLPDRSLVFATAERLYRIDTEGDPLPGFSLRLPQGATQGAVASTESGDRIRIDVPTRSGLLSVDGRGARLGSTRRRIADQANRDKRLPIDSPTQHEDLPTDCGPNAYVGALNDDGQVYLLCGKADGALHCYLWDH